MHKSYVCRELPTEIEKKLNTLSVGVSTYKSIFNKRCSFLVWLGAVNWSFN